ncbi:MAG TPA: hypothetical protein VFS21_39385 [Roseiflexaceae bacterium]|nr:hypothetical protein [Roseiflexaceae bacterium]
MTPVTTLYHLIRADVQERVRRYNFMIALLFTVFVTYLFVPPLDASVYLMLNMGGYRPIYNSAWVGSMVTLLMVEFFPLFGFYFAKGTIENDLRTGVGAIIATTPMGKLTYAFGKWLSHVLVFTLMVLLIGLASAALQLLRGEDRALDLWALLSPFFIILLPALAFVAAVAVLFECVNELRGGLGNIVYFLVYIVVAISTDFQGIAVLWPSIYQACSASFASCSEFRQIDLSSTPLQTLPTFVYPGVAWTTGLVLSRLAWVVAGGVVVALAGVLFHRFDPSKLSANRATALADRIKQALIGFVSRPPAQTDEPETALAPAAAPAIRASQLTAPQLLSGSAQLYPRLFAAEVRLALKGVPLWWYLGAAGLIAASLLVSLELAQLLVLPLAWIWPLLIWSALGAREIRANISQIVFSGPFPIQRQLPATWLLGVTVALVMAGGVLLRLLFAGAWTSAGAVVVGALFVPSLALALGSLSGGSKLFEAVYLFLWYMAVVQSIPYLDYMGRFAETTAWGLPLVYVALTLLLFGLAVAGRLFHMRH